MAGRLEDFLAFSGTPRRVDGAAEAGADDRGREEAAATAAGCFRLMKGTISGYGGICLTPEGNNETVTSCMREMVERALVRTERSGYLLGVISLVIIDIFSRIRTCDFWGQNE